MNDLMKCASLGFFLLFASLQVKASQMDLTEMREQIKHYVQEELQASFLEGQTDIEVGKIDSRLVLKQCEHPLDIGLSHGQWTDARVTVKVKCPTLSWQVRIPVQIKRYAQVLFAKNMIKRGEMVDVTDLGTMTVNVASLNRFYKDAEELAGYAARINIRPGQILKPSHVKLPQIIKRGDSVKIELNFPGFTIEANGVAMSHGVKNQTIRVKNTSSNKMIDAVVVNKNRVKVSI